MIPPHPDILTVRDAEILRGLHQLGEIGIYRKQWTHEDIPRVVLERLVRRDAEVVPLHVVEDEPEAVVTYAEDGALIAELTQAQADVVALCDGGLTNEEIAERLDTTVGGVRQRLIHISSVLGARDRTQIVYMILADKARIVIRPHGNRKKAS